MIILSLLFYFRINNRSDNWKNNY